MLFKFSVKQSIILLVICAFFWGSCFPIGKDVLEQMEPISVVFWRFLLASICLYYYIYMKKLRFPNLSVMTWLFIFVISMLGVGGFNVLMYAGLTYTNSINGSLIMSLSPMITSLMLHISIRKTPKLMNVIGLGVSLSGVMLVITNCNIEVIRNLRVNFGDQLIILAMLSWSFYTFLSGYITKYIEPLLYVFIGMLSSCILAAIAWFYIGNTNILMELRSLTGVGKIELIYVSVFGTVFSYVIWLDCVDKVGSELTSTYFNLVPVFAIFVSILYGYKIDWVQMLGIIAVIAGLIAPKIKMTAMRLKIK
ncbi:DMT family transporter [Tolumonas lignilytica]|uniref:DMT family transporter n=1 Tax=Tolumonas lignilytica TaxID=1283284 RepID=UPI000466B45C|nr:DMT family transporter [Tolumonas lignilytica]